MAESRVLIVEDDFHISNVLQLYFRSQGYEASVALRGGDALEMCREQLPQVVVLDIMLPDIDGYEVCRKLRGNLRTSHIPIIFLTQKDERADKIQGLELGADDYITKPFDVEELRLRVQNTIRRARYESLTDPITGLPGGRLIEEQLRSLLRRDMWGLIYIGVTGLDAFRQVYGFVAGDEMQRFLAMILGRAVDQCGTSNDFIGHSGGDDFVVITSKDRVEGIVASLREQFDADAGTHYDWQTRQRGHLLVRDDHGNEQQTDLMQLTVGMVTADDGPFADIREITQCAASVRRVPGAD